ncbi:WD40-repeat-containing domain protein [Crepidotus variabilis]|uniref:WD40-repeat-containing domain protein n=1 Tax=Crepidotus variabilis TaxID=179855 RepID=A0A9P6EL39_9AGAR|nr:WD40-repeat-containing domain protein [Crepidotus variabilis]
MRFKTLEIRWHDSKPISSCDFQPVSFKRARPGVGQEKNYASQSYRLATGGDDNHVRIWMVHPLLRPPCLLAEADAMVTASAPKPPRVEYLATLGRHSAPVNVVRFSPNGELIASAGDDGMIIIWAPTATAPAAPYGSDITAEDLQHEKEYWKQRTSFKCTDMQVYDLAWSPTGEYILAGSTDNVARIFAAADGKLIHHFADHKHFVQGVAWDPLNEYIATQSSDRSMHIYHISTQSGVLEVAPHRHEKMAIRHSHSRTPSTHAGPSNANNIPPRPRMQRHESTASDVESNSALAIDIDETMSVTSGKEGAPLTPATSVSSTPFMGPPPPIEASSRRSSFSSNAPNSPSISMANSSRYGRSPSPIPPLPAIRSPSASATAALWAQVKLYGDESHTNFFRRLTFSPDGGLLLTPAGQFDDPFANLKSAGEESAPRGRRGHPSDSNGGLTQGKTSSVYIYSRANFARAPIAQLPGHKKPSVAVRFSPVLYELRPNVVMSGFEEEKISNPPIGVLEKGLDGVMDVDIVGLVHAPQQTHLAEPSSLLTPQKTPSHPAIVTPTPRSAGSISRLVQSSPALSPMDLRLPTPAASKPSTPVPTHGHSHSHSATPAQATAPTGSVFALPYRLLFAVVTMDTVAIYDTQQSGPICLLTKLHYDEFTDMSWSPDGQCLILSSRDGYCTLIAFDDILPAYHTQQHTLQLQSIAHHHSLPLTVSTPSHAPSSSTQVTPAVTPVSTNVGLPFVSSTPTSTSGNNPKKRPEPPLTPAASVDGSEGQGSSVAASSNRVSADTQSGSVESTKATEPPKKKRRVALTQLGDKQT